MTPSMAVRMDMVVVVDVNRSGGGEDQPAGLDALDADQGVGQVADLGGGPA